MPHNTGAVRRSKSLKQDLVPSLHARILAAVAKEPGLPNTRVWKAEQTASAGARDTNFSHVYVPRNPALLEQIFGLWPGSTTRRALSFSDNDRGTFVAARPDPMRPFDPSMPFTGDVCRDAADPSRCKETFGMDLVANNNSALYDYTLGALLKTVNPLAQALSRIWEPTTDFVSACVRKIEASPPTDVPVRAVLLDMFKLVPAPRREEWYDNLLPVVEMLVCAYQFDEVSYGDMLAAVYAVAAMMFVLQRLDNALITDLVITPFVHHPLQVRLQRVQTALGGRLLSELLHHKVHETPKQQSGHWLPAALGGTLWMGAMLSSSWDDLGRLYSASAKSAKVFAKLATAQLDTDAKWTRTYNKLNRVAKPLAVARQAGPDSINFSAPWFLTLQLARAGAVNSTTAASLAGALFVKNFLLFGHDGTTTEDKAFRSRAAGTQALVMAMQGNAHLATTAADAALASLGPDGCNEVVVAWASTLGFAENRTMHPAYVLGGIVAQLLQPAPIMLTTRATLVRAFVAGSGLFGGCVSLNTTVPSYDTFNLQRQIDVYLSDQNVLLLANSVATVMGKFYAQ